MGATQQSGKVAGGEKTPRFMRFRGACLWLAVSFLLLPISSEAQHQALSLPTEFHFDGTSYITLANSPALAPTSQITIAAWIKPDFSVSNVTDTILDKRDGCGFNRSYQLGVIKTLQNYTPGTIFFAASNANTDDLFSSVPVPNDGKFHHVAGTYDGSSVKVFLDGVLVGQGTHTGQISTTSDPPVIGIQAGCGDLTYADIGPIKLFDHALPDGQIMSDGTGEFAALIGGNNFVGDQNVTGAVNAISFTGNGSGLSNITAANISPGTAAISISGTAASAATAITATNADNASGLAGVSAANYARRDIANTFTGNQNVVGSVSASGNLTIGSGTPIVKHNSSLIQNVAFNTKLGPTTCLVWLSSASAADGDTIITTLSGSLMSANIVHAAYVLNNIVQVRICNPTGAPTQIGSGSVRVDVWKH